MLSHINNRPWRVGLAMIVLLAACSPVQPPRTDEAANPLSAEVRAERLARGEEIISQAGKALSTVLIEAIGQGGYTNALPLCSVQAIPLTTALAQANDVRLRRVSHRARNPANGANARELEILQRFQTALESGDKPPPEIVASPDGAATFYAPIVITRDLCLNCHGQPGQTLQPELVPILAELYPQDQATGFKLNDLRGLWRVDFPNTAGP